MKLFTSKLHFDIIKLYGANFTYKIKFGRIDHYEYEFSDPDKYLEFCLKYPEYIINE